MPRPLGKITDRQQEVLDFIKKQIAENGYSPSQTEIAAEFQIAQTSAREFIMTLHRKGHLKFTPGIARGIKCVA